MFICIQGYINQICILPHGWWLNISFDTFDTIPSTDIDIIIISILILRTFTSDLIHSQTAIKLKFSKILIYEEEYVYVDYTSFGRN